MTPAPGSLANPALPPPFGRAIGINVVIGVSVRAMCSPSLHRRKTNSAEDVGSTGDCLKVRGVDAMPDAAKVVKFETGRNGANAKFVGIAMDKCLSRCPSTKADEPIATRNDGSRPDPARAKMRSIFRDGPVEVYLRPKTIWSRLRAHRILQRFGVMGQAVTSGAVPLVYIDGGPPQ